MLKPAAFVKGLSCAVSLGSKLWAGNKKGRSMVSAAPFFKIFSVGYVPLIMPIT